MKYCFASIENNDFEDYLNECNPKYILGSFWYVRLLDIHNLELYLNYVNSEKCGLFILDSGAFSLFSKGITEEGLQDYTDKYIQFINEYDIKNFIELDIDKLFPEGYARVKEITNYIEQQTGKNVIPVFHNNTRTIDDLHEMIEKYDYIAISNINGKKLGLAQMFNKFVNYCHSIKPTLRIHGLALTGASITSKVNFFSCDSSSWKSSVRFGTTPYFRDNRIIAKPISDTYRIDQSLASRNQLFRKAMLEYMKYALYLERNDKPLYEGKL